MTMEKREMENLLHKLNDTEIERSYLSFQLSELHSIKKIQRQTVNAHNNDTKFETTIQARDSRATKTIIGSKSLSTVVTSKTTSKMSALPKKSSSSIATKTESTLTNASSSNVSSNRSQRKSHYNALVAERLLDYQNVSNNIARLTESNTSSGKFYKKLKRKNDEFCSTDPILFNLRLAIKNLNLKN